MITKRMKRIVLGFVMGLSVMVPLEAVTNITAVAEITGLNANDRHNPLYGLFGAGMENMSSADEANAFNQYYDFCKGTERGLETSTPLTTTSAKANFGVLLKGIAANYTLAPPIDTFKISVPAIAGEAAAPEFLMSVLDGDEAIESANRDRIFEMWREAQLCSNYLTYTDSSPVTDEVGTYALATYSGVLTAQVSVESQDSGIRYRVMQDGDLYRMCYEDATKRDRDIALLLSDTNTAAMLGFVDGSSGGNSFTSSKHILHLVLFGIHSDLAAALDANSSFYKDTSIDINAYHINRFKIRPWNTLQQNLQNSGTLATNTALRQTGLGYYCDQINGLSSQGDTSSIEACVKSHINAVVNNDFNSSGQICDSNIAGCGDVTPSGTSSIHSRTLPGYILPGATLTSNSVYNIPSFGYCLSDADQDGFLESGGTFDWGTLDDVSKTPYTATQAASFDTCPSNAALQSPGNNWYPDTDSDGVGDAGSVAVQSCVDPSVGQATINGAVHYSTDSDTCPLNAALQSPGNNWYPDTDSDGVGDAGSVAVQSCVDTSSVSQISINNVSHYLTNVDACPNNANLQVPGNNWYPDTDSDGVGDAGSVAVKSCADPSSVTQTTINSVVHYLTNVDTCPNNASLQVPGNSWYLDVDRNGVGDVGTTAVQSCANTALGVTTIGGQNYVTQAPPTISSETQPTVSNTFEITVTGNSKVVQLTRSLDGETQINSLVSSAESSEARSFALSVVDNHIAELSINQDVSGNVTIVGSKDNDGEVNQVLVQSNDVPLKVSRNSSNDIEKYCLSVKGNASDLSTEYLVMIPAYGVTPGVMETYRVVAGDGSEGTQIQRISLNTQNALEEGALFNKDTAEKSGDCDYTQVPE